MGSKVVMSFLQDDSKILLGCKKRGYNTGFWSGIIGDYIFSTDTEEQAAHSGLVKRSGITAFALKKFAVIDIKYEDEEKFMQFHLFKSSNFVGELKESADVKPEWFQIHEVPFQSMWLEEKYWLSYLIDGQCFIGSFLYDEYNDLYECHLDVVSEYNFNQLVGTS